MRKKLDLCTKIAKKLVKQKREIIWITPSIAHAVRLERLDKKLYSHIYLFHHLEQFKTPLDFVTVIYSNYITQFKHCKLAFVLDYPDILEPLPITSIVKEYCKLYNYPCIIACTGKSALNNK